MLMTTTIMFKTTTTTIMFMIVLTVTNHRDHHHHHDTVIIMILMTSMALMVTLMKVKMLTKVASKLFYVCGRYCEECYKKAPIEHCFSNNQNAVLLVALHSSSDNTTGT